MVNYCKTCGLLDPAQNVCRLYKVKMDPNEDFCGRHTKDVYTCEVCGAITLQPVYDLEEGGSCHLLCMNCATQRNTCLFCKNNTECAFETDPSPLPKVIMKTIQQSNMVMQQQVLNPDRIEITCKKNCKCFDAENGCLRQNNSCGNHDFKWPGE